MGDRAYVILYTKQVQPSPASLVCELGGVMSVCSSLEHSGLVSYATKGSYPEFVLDELVTLDVVPEGTIALSINDSGEARSYTFEKGAWIAHLLTPNHPGIPEDLYKAWLAQAATLTQKDEEIRRLKYEISVLKGKLP